MLQHCVKSISIRRYSGPYSVQIWQNVDQNNSEFEHFHAVQVIQNKIDFIALKAEVDKLDINKFVNVSTSLNNSNTKVDDLNVSK